MSKADGVFVYLGTYPNEVAAREDYEIVKAFHAEGAIGTYDAAVVTKDVAGRVHENKDETTTRRGAWGGLAVGALFGLLFPPAIVDSAVVGATIGGVGGHLAKGLSRADVKQLGELIDDGQACLLVIGESTVEAAVERAGLKAEKQVAKQLDIDPKDLDAAVRDAAAELGVA